MKNKCPECNSKDIAYIESNPSIIYHCRDCSCRWGYSDEDKMEII